MKDEAQGGIAWAAYKAKGARLLGKPTEGFSFVDEVPTVAGPALAALVAVPADA